ncbi:MAG TPA: hypothetical protein VGP51_04185 [Nocardioidaceae bacterium]|nr:hypothetical protein [Nocardioidaceae bacterium]
MDDAFQDLPVIPKRLAALALRTWQQRLDPRPLSIGQNSVT